MAAILILPENEAFRKVDLGGVLCVFLYSPTDESNYVEKYLILNIFVHFQWSTITSLPGLIWAQYRGNITASSRRVNHYNIELFGVKLKQPLGMSSIFVLNSVLK